MDFPIEYRDRMLAEQMAMMEALQFIAQFLICFVVLLALVFLIVNISGIVRTRLSKRRLSEHGQPQSSAARRRSSAIPFGVKTRAFRCGPAVPRQLVHERGGDSDVRSPHRDTRMPGRTC